VQDSSHLYESDIARQGGIHEPADETTPVRWASLRANSAVGIRTAATGVTMMWTNASSASVFCVSLLGVQHGEVAGTFAGRPKPLIGSPLRTRLWLFTGIRTLTGRVGLIPTRLRSSEKVDGGAR
jgi:hypothetical protein